MPLAALGSDASPPGSGVALLKDYKFEDGGYSIVGVSSNRITNEIQEELGDFYTDDIEVMNQMKASWVTGEQSPVFACGYQYEIYIKKAGTLTESFAINLNKDCNTVVTSDGYYYFDPQKLAAFAGKLKKARREEKTFSSLAEGRDYLASSVQGKDLLIYFQPDWADHEGEFNLDIQCGAHDLGSPLLDACREDLEAKMRADHPDEPFVLVETLRMSSGKMSLTIKCARTAYEKFRKYGTPGEWQDYIPTLTLVLRNAPSGAPAAKNTTLADCDNSVYYSCDAAQDTLRIYDQFLCEDKGISSAHSQPLTYINDGGFVAATATCELKSRTYVIELSPCQAGPRQVPLVRISSGNKTVFSGSYGLKCSDAEPLMYFHYATSGEVEIGKRLLRWKKR